MELNSYKTTLLHFTESLRNLQVTAQKLNMIDSMKKIKKLSSSIENELFHLVIVGEFSRGKSTFVNALLGRKILPASKNPTTAIISKIVYGDTPAYQIYYKSDKSPQSMEEASFKKITAPPEPDESDADSVDEFLRAQEEISEIDFARITYPLPFCRDGVEVVDTPGTNDLNVGRMEITYSYLNQADAVILLLAAYQPLTASEMQFLKERILGNQIEDIFFIISHKDDLDTPEQENDVLNYAKEHLRNILPPGFKLKNRIFLVNSLGALYSHMQENGEELTAKQELKIPDDFNDTGFPDFESALGDFLANDKGMIRLRKHNRNAQIVIRTMQHDLSVNIGIVSHSADEIRQKAAEMAPKFQQVKLRAERIVSDMRYSIEAAASDIDYKCHTAANAMLSKAKDAVNGLTKDMSASAMQQAIEREVTAEKKHFMDSILKDWQETFQKETEKANISLRSIWNDIDVEYQRSFNLPAVLDNSSNAITISKPNNKKAFSKQAYNMADDMFRSINKEDNILIIMGGIGIGAVAGAIGIVADLFSAFFGNSHESWRDKIRSEVIRAYSGQGNRMSSVMKPLYLAKAEEVCKDLQENVNARISDMEHQLQEILREKEAQEQDADNKKSYLLSKQEELRRISHELNRLAL